MLEALLVEDFRKGRVPTARLRRAQVDGFASFGLEQTASVRPPALRKKLPLDDALFEQLGTKLARSALAGKRLGREWDVSNQTVIQRKSEDDHWVNREDLKPLDDVCTRFCTRMFFPDAQARIQMIANVVRVYDRVAKKAGLAYHIVFKGGVMMRLLLVEFLHDLRVDVRHEAIEYVSGAQKAVGVSDFDFEIVPEAHAPSADTVHRHLAVNYAVLLWLQKQLEGEVEGTRPPLLLRVDWDREEGSRTLRKMLEEAVAELATGHPLRGIRVDHALIARGSKTPTHLPHHRTRSGLAHASPRENLFIFACRDRKETCVAPAEAVFRDLGVGTLVRPFVRSHGAFYATLNGYIGEGEERMHKHHMVGLFHLARIKYSFGLYYTTRDGERRVDRLSGEIVDLSQSHGTRHDEVRRHMYEEVAHPYRDYPILSVDASVVKIRSYSIDGFLHDQQDVLHHSKDPPWRSNKLAKRLVRYCLLLALHVFGEDLSSARRLDALRQLAKRVRTPDAILEGSMLHTGIESVDSFFWHERMALRLHGASSGDAKARGDYYRTLSKHLATLTTLLETHATRPAWSKESAAFVNAVHMEHSDDYNS